MAGRSGPRRVAMPLPARSLPPAPAAAHQVALQVRPIRAEQMPWCRLAGAALPEAAPHALLLADLLAAGTEEAFRERLLQVRHA